MNVGLNLKKPLAGLQGDIGVHQARLRALLRSLEDGSFDDKARQPRPGAVLQFQFGPMLLPPEASAVSACNDCFLGFTRSLVEFIDRLLAMRKIAATTLTIPAHVKSHADLDAYVGGLLEVAYQDVARNTGLSNPAKVGQFARLDAFEREATLSYFSVRRSLEHHAGIPQDDITVTYYRPYLQAGTAEITRLGEPLPPNTGIALTAEVPRHRFAKGVKIALSEGEIEHIGFTIQHVIGPSFTSATIDS
jgi:hypothetical protein